MPGQPISPISPNPTQPTGGQLVLTPEKKAAWKELYRRGALQGEKKRAYEELQQRGVFGAPVLAKVQTPTTASDLPQEPPAAPAGKNFLAGQGINPGAVGQGVRENVRVNAPAVQEYGNRNFDTSGLGWGDSNTFLTLDNEKERYGFLNDGVAAGKWQSFGKTKDTGEWYVVQNGKPKAVIGGNFFKNLTAGMAAHPFQYYGMAAGAMVPEWRAAEATEAGVVAGVGYMAKRALTGTLYNGVRASLVAAGSAAGFAADEIVKWTEGLWNKSSAEEKWALGEAATTGALSEFAMRALGSTVKVARQGARPRMTQEQADRTADALRRGIVPHLSQAAPPARLFAFEQSAAEYVFGNHRQGGNVEALLDQIHLKLRQAGMNQSQAASAVKNIKEAYAARVNTTAAGQAAERGATEIAGAKGQAVESQRVDLQKRLDRMFTDLEKGIGSTDPRIQDQVRQALIDARVAFSGRVGQMYDLVDAIVARESPNPVVVDASRIKQVAIQIWKELPRDQYQQVILHDKALGGTMMEIFNLPEFISFKQAQKIRTDLFRSGAYRDLSPDARTVGFNKLGQAVDKAFDDASLSAANPEAVRALRAADAEWGKGIRKFQGYRVKQLVQEAERTKIVDPEVTARLIFQEGHLGEAVRIKNLLPPEMWNKVTAAYWSAIKKDATDQLTGLVDANRLLREVNKRGKLLDAAYGRQRAASIKQFAQRNAALNGKLPADQLTQDNFATLLNEYQRSSKLYDAFMKDNFVKALTDEGARRMEAVDYMMQSPDRIIQARNFFGPWSPIWGKVKSAVMTRLISNAIGPDETAMSAMFKPGGLSGALRDFTQEQLDGVFGSAVSKDLRELARTIDFAATKPFGKMTGVLAAAHWILAPFTHAKSLAFLYAMGDLYSKDWFVKWFSQGLKASTKEAQNKFMRDGKMLIYSMMPTLQHAINSGGQQVYVTGIHAVDEAAP